MGSCGLCCRDEVQVKLPLTFYQATHEVILKKRLQSMARPYRGVAGFVMNKRMHSLGIVL